MVEISSWFQQRQTLDNRSKVTMSTMRSGHNLYNEIRSQPEGRHRFWTRGFKIRRTPTTEIVPTRTSCESNGNIYPAESGEDYVVISNLISKLINEELMREGEKEGESKYLPDFFQVFTTSLLLSFPFQRVDANG